MIPVRDIDIKKDMSVKELANQFLSAGGFTAKKLGQSIAIFNEMLEDKDCAKFFSFPACIMATGTRGAIKHLVKNKMVDVIITTCGTLDHDIARSKADYYHGAFELDDKELHKKEIHRLGNVVFPVKNHGAIIEDFMQPLLADLYKERNEWSTRDLCWEIGKRLDESCVLYWAWKNKIPVFIPGPTDGSVGSQVWMFYQQHKDFKLDLLADEQELCNLVFDAKKTGALVVGGGISKHHTIWWNQFRGGLDYAIYLTAAPEWDGSLSGAKTSEAISWSKVNELAKHVTVEGDATILLPILVAAAKKYIIK